MLRFGELDANLEPQLLTFSIVVILGRDSK